MRGKNLGKVVMKGGGAAGGDCGLWASASSPPLANRSFPTQGKIRADVLEKIRQEEPGVWTNLWSTLG